MVEGPVEAESRVKGLILKKNEKSKKEFPSVLVS